MEIRAVRVGNRYGPEYEDYLKSKLPSIQFLNEEQNGLQLQWNKLNFFSLDIDEPVCVIDIDIVLLNDYEKLFSLDVSPGEFLTVRQWWDPNSKSEINGVFYKFYPKDTKYIFDKMMEDPEYWQSYFIKNNIKPGPVNGEENFVEMMARQKLNIKYVPDEWVCRMPTNRKLISRINALSSLPYVYLGGYHPEIKLVHFNGIGNYPKFS